MDLDPQNSVDLWPRRNSSPDEMNALVQQELVNLKALKRLSINSSGSATQDPDLPDIELTEAGNSPPRDPDCLVSGGDTRFTRQPSIVKQRSIKRERSIRRDRSITGESPKRERSLPPQPHPQSPTPVQQQQSEQHQYGGNNGSDDIENIWVPAGLHPELAPNEWQAFVSEKLAEIRNSQEAQQQSKLSRHSSRLSHVVEAPDQYVDAAAILDRRRKSSQGDKRRSILELSKEFVDSTNNEARDAAAPDVLDGPPPAPAPQTFSTTEDEPDLVPGALKHAGATSLRRSTHRLHKPALRSRSQRLRDEERQRKIDIEGNQEPQQHQEYQHHQQEHHQHQQYQHQHYQHQQEHYYQHQQPHNVQEQHQQHHHVQQSQHVQQPPDSPAPPVHRINTPDPKEEILGHSPFGYSRSIYSPVPSTPPESGRSNEPLNATPVAPLHSSRGFRPSGSSGSFAPSSPSSTASHKGRTHSRARPPLSVSIVAAKAMAHTAEQPHSPSAVTPSPTASTMLGYRRRKKLQDGNSISPTASSGGAADTSISPSHSVESLSPDEIPERDPSRPPVPRHYSLRGTNAKDLNEIQGLPASAQDTQHEPEPVVKDLRSTEPKKTQPVKLDSPFFTPAKVEPKEPKPEPREPKPESKLEPKLEPKLESKLEPKVEHREPKPEPREFKPEPRESREPRELKVSKPEVEVRPENIDKPEQALKKDLFAEHSRSLRKSREQPKDNTSPKDGSKSDRRWRWLDSSSKSKEKDEPKKSFTNLFKKRDTKAKTNDQDNTSPTKIQRRQQADPHGDAKARSPTDKSAGTSPTGGSPTKSPTGPPNVSPTGEPATVSPTGTPRRRGHARADSRIRNDAIPDENTEVAPQIKLPYEIPAHQVSDRSHVMMHHRFPLHIERAIYRLSHMKLANPRRPLRQQVLLSNFMYAYLNVVNKSFQQQQMAQIAEQRMQEAEQRGFGHLEESQIEQLRKVETNSYGAGLYSTDGEEMDDSSSSSDEEEDEDDNIGAAEPMIGRS